MTRYRWMLTYQKANKEWKKHVTFRIREGQPIRIATSEVVIEADTAAVNNLEASPAISACLQAARIKAEPALSNRAKTRC
jgi:hypothetical protein